MLARLPTQAWTKPRVAETSQQRQNGRESTQESSDPPRLNLALKISSIEEAVGRLSGARLTLSPHRATAALDPKATFLDRSIEQLAPTVQDTPLRSLATEQSVLKVTSPGKPVGNMARKARKTLATRFHQRALGYPPSPAACQHLVR